MSVKALTYSDALISAVIHDGTYTDAAKNKTYTLKDIFSKEKKAAKFVNAEKLYTTAVQNFEEAKQILSKKDDPEAMARLLRAVQIIENADIKSSPLQAKRNFIIAFFSRRYGDLNKHQTILDESKKIIQEHLQDYLVVKAKDNSEFRSFAEKFSKGGFEQIDQMLSLVTNPFNKYSWYSSLIAKKKTLKVFCKFCAHWHNVKNALRSDNIELANKELDLLLGHPYLSQFVTTDNRSKSTKEERLDFLQGTLPFTHLINATNDSEHQNIIERLHTLQPTIERLMVGNPSLKKLWLQLRAPYLYPIKTYFWENDFNKFWGKSFKEFCSHPDIKPFAKFILKPDKGVIGLSAPFATPLTERQALHKLSENNNELMKQCLSLQPKPHIPTSSSAIDYSPIKLGTSEYIASAAPSKKQVRPYFDELFAHNSNVIVNLHTDSPNIIKLILDSHNEVLHYPGIKIALVNKTTTEVANTTQTITEATIKVTINNTPVEYKVLQLNDWKADAPPDSRALAALHEKTVAAEETFGKPITVSCEDGVAKTSTFIMYHHLRNDPPIQDPYWGGTMTPQHYENPVSVLTQYRRCRETSHDPVHFAAVIGLEPEESYIPSQPLPPETYSGKDIRQILSEGSLSSANQTLSFQDLIHHESFLSSPKLYNETYKIMKEAASKVEKGDMSAMPTLYRCHAVLNSKHVSKLHAEAIKKHEKSRFFVISSASFLAFERKIPELFNKHFDEYMKARQANSTSLGDLERKLAKSSERIQKFITAFDDPNSKDEYTDDVPGQVTKWHNEMKSLVVGGKIRQAEKVWNKILTYLHERSRYPKNLKGKIALEHLLWGDPPLYKHILPVKFYYDYYNYFGSLRYVIDEIDSNPKLLDKLFPYLIGGCFENKNERDYNMRDFVKDHVSGPTKDLYNTIKLNDEVYTSYNLTGRQHREEKHFLTKFLNFGYERIIKHKDFEKHFQTLKNLSQTNLNTSSVLLDDKAYFIENFSENNSPNVLFDYFNRLSAQNIRTVVGLQSGIESHLPQTIGESVSIKDMTIKLAKTSLEKDGECLTFQVTRFGKTKEYSWLKPKSDLIGKENVNNLREFNRLVIKFAPKNPPSLAIIADNDEYSSLFAIYHRHREKTARSPVSSVAQYRALRSGINNKETLATLFAALNKDKIEREER